MTKEETQVIILRELIRFLKENNVYRIYRYYLAHASQVSRDWYNWTSLKRLVNKAIDNYDNTHSRRYPQDIDGPIDLLYVFSWDRTSQGVSFWNSLDIRWAPIFRKWVCKYLYNN